MSSWDRPGPPWEPQEEPAGPPLEQGYWQGTGYDPGQAPSGGYYPGNSGPGYPDQGRPGQGYPDQGYPDQGYGQGRPDQGRPDQGRPDQGRPDQGRAGRGRAGRGRASQDRPDQGYPDQGYPDQGYGQPGYDQDFGPGYPDQGRPGPGYPDQGYPDQGYPDQGYPDQGYPDQGYPDQGYPDQGYPDQGFGQPGYDQDYGPDTYRQGGRDYGSDWNREPRGSMGKALIGVVVIVIVVAGIAVGGLKLTHKGPFKPTAAATNSTGAGNTRQGTGTTPPKVVLYALTAPAAAGGYKATNQVPQSQVFIAQQMAAKLRQQVESSGAGKVTQTVKNGYLVNHNLLAAYTGFNGSFQPALIMQGLKTQATGSAPVTAGPHGGNMACGKSAGGTICVWTTGKTLAMIEFFNAAGAVTLPNATAGTYALNVRNSVEVAAR